MHTAVQYFKMGILLKNRIITIRQTVGVELRQDNMFRARPCPPKSILKDALAHKPASVTGISAWKIWKLLTNLTNV
jgi:hypothetical protein